MKKIIISLIFLVSLSDNNSTAQNFVPWCGFDTLMGQQQQNNPNFLNELQQSDLLIKDFIDNYINNNNNNNQIQNIFPPATYVIPVVVHVIYPAGNPNYPTNISYTQIQSQIDALNAAFAKQYGTGYNNGQGHTQYAVNTEIQFCLAQKTPQCMNNGNGWTSPSEPGVMRWATNNTEYNLPYGQSGEQMLKNLTHNTNCKFEFNEYLNIWIVNTIGGGNSIIAYGTFPFPTPPFIDGIVSRADVFGDNTIPGNNFNLMPQLDQGKILAHEAGHYLNLWHTHHNGCSGLNDPGQPDPCDLNGDRVCDTPPSTVIGYSCNGQTFNTCAETTTATNGNINDILEAYMSYSDDNCMNTFTDGQKLRMWATINLYRANLVTLQNQIKTGIFGPQGCLPAQVLAGIYPSNTNPCINTTVTLNTEMPPANTANTWLWTITPGTFIFVGGTNNTSQTPQVQFTAPGLYTISLTATDGNTIVTNTVQIFVSACAPLTNKLEQANWYFGKNAALSFISGSAVPIQPSMIYSDEACAAVSDQNGQLLFYTDGRRVWDKTHAIMPANVNTQLNGSPNSPGPGLGQLSSAQGALIVPDPGNANRYYIFVSPDSPYNNITQSLQYSVVDITLNNGNGDLISINQNVPGVFSNIGEHLTAVPHCNGIDYWIIVKPITNPYHDKIFAYLLTANGIINPVISSSFIQGPGNNLQGFFKFSPDGQLMAARTNANNTVSTLLYTFNNSTGFFTIASTINNAGNYSFSFSPNSKYLYLPTGNVIKQYDVSNPNSPTLTNNIGTNNLNGYNGIQLGPDDKIYLTNKNLIFSNQNHLLGVINTPNSVAPNYIWNQVQLISGQLGHLGLPNMIDANLLPPSPANFTVTYVNCSTVTVTLDACWAPMYNATWNFGDGSPNVTGPTATHTYSSNGNYTITLTLSNQNGSFPPITQQVSVIATAPVISGPVTVCSGSFPPAQYAVTSLPGATYVWSIISGTGTIVNGQGTNEVTINWQIGTAMLQVVITYNGCTFTSQIEVNIVPGLTVDLGPDVIICQGGSYQLCPVSITGGTQPFTYLWTPGGQTSPCITVSTPGTYSLTVTDVNGCYAQDNINITISNQPAPVVSITSTINYICISDNPFNLTATPPGGVWSGPGITNPITGLFDPQAAGAGVHTVAYTYTDISGCVNSAYHTITVDGNCCPGIKIPAGNHSNSTPFTTTQAIAINYPITITGNVTFNCPDIRINSGVSITVLPGATLTITNKSWLHTCNDMWEGIILQPGANFVMNGNSLIEDAKAALTSHGGADFTFNQAVLNKNRVHIQLTGFAGNHAGSIRNTVLTCRELDIVYSTIPFPPGNNIPNNFSALLKPHNYLGNLPLATLKAPYLNSRTFAGVLVNDVGSLQVGTFAGGNNSSNTFDNMHYGIHAENTNMVVYNNLFENLTGKTIVCQYPNGPCDPPIGVAIYATDKNFDAMQPATWNSLEVGGTGNPFKKNYFYDCYRGVDVEDYTAVDIQNNLFSATSNTQPLQSNNQLGNLGIFVKAAYTSLLNVQNNHITNYRTGIHALYNKYPMGGPAKYINKNTIIRTGTNICNYGIIYEGLKPETGIPPFPVPFTPNAELNQNNINQANTCILVRTRQLFTVKDNSPLLINPNTIIHPSIANTRNGIRLENCRSFTVQGNAISGNGSSLAGVSCRGIYTITSGAGKYFCNNIAYTGQSMVFEGLCSGSNIRNNTFNTAYDGFVLMNNGLLGPTYPLGSPGSPADNKWQGSFFNSQTYTLNTFNVNTHSPMYVRTGTTYNPVNNQSSPPGDYIPNLTTGPFNNQLCNALPNLPPGNPNPAFMEQVVQDALPYPVFPAETSWQNKEKVFKQLKETPQLMNNSPILQSFYATAIGGSMQAFDSTDVSLKNYNYTQAALQNASVNPQVQPENTKQTVNGVYIDYLQYGISSIDSSDIALLENAANACHLEQGEALFTARTFYNYLLNDAFVFADSCTYYNNTRLLPEENTPQAATNMKKFSIYPNPNNGNMQVNYLLPEGSMGKLSIKDVSGKTVAEYTLVPEHELLQISEAALKNGVYFYTCYINNEPVVTGKLVIIH